MNGIRAKKKNKKKIDINENLYWLSNNHLPTQPDFLTVLPICRTNSCPYIAPLHCNNISHTDYIRLPSAG